MSHVFHVFLDIDAALRSDWPGRGLEDIRTVVDGVPELSPIVGFGGRGQGHKDLWEHTKQVVQNVAAAGGERHVRWAALFHDAGKPHCFKRDGSKVSFHGHEKISAKLAEDFFLRERAGWLSHEVPEIVELLGRVEGYSPEWTDSAVRRISKELGSHLISVTLLAGCDCTSKHAAKREKYLGLAMDLRRRVEEIRELDSRAPALPKGLGNTLMERLSVRGRELGRVMDWLRQEVEIGSLPRNDQDHSAYVEYAENLRGIWNEAW